MCQSDGEEISAVVSVVQQEIDLGNGQVAGGCRVPPVSLWAVGQNLVTRRDNRPVYRAEADFWDPTNVTDYGRIGARFPGNFTFRHHDSFSGSDPPNRCRNWIKLLAATARSPSNSNWQPSKY
jgi:hypothetical protein